MTEVAVELRIAGLVQGVFYRAWAVERARRRGLRGWVRNRRDGSVEARLIGPAPAVEAMIEDCRQGPPGARVEAVERVPAEDDGSLGFRTLRSE
ncbi:MAG: acylphosphatase [Pseudomonadota bacterium]